MSFIVLKKCLSEPKQLVKLTILVLCVCVAIYQLSDCFNKIINPPISTYYKFKLNESISYPSITLCRVPGYKTERFHKYGISKSANMYHAVTYKNFNFSMHTLQEFYEDVTYNYDDVFKALGFDDQRANLTNTSIFLRMHGRCHILTPLRNSEKFSEEGGYYMSLKHTAVEKVTDAFGTSTTGFHVYMHDPDETLTDTKIQENSFMAYLYVETFEELRINLRIEEFKQVPSSHHKCSSRLGYSKSVCEEDCIHSKITDLVNCSVPWIPRLQLPPCEDYESVEEIIKGKNDLNLRKYRYECACKVPCNVSVYSTYTQSRKESQTARSTLRIYLSSNLMTEMQEVVGYDWNMFLSDMGGSLGFLLGLSVIGAIKMVETLILNVISHKKQIENEESIPQETNEISKQENTKRNNNIDVPQIKIFVPTDDDIDKDKMLRKNKMEYCSNSDFYKNQNDKGYIISNKF